MPTITPFDDQSIVSYFGLGIFVAPPTFIAADGQDLLQ